MSVHMKTWRDFPKIPDDSGLRNPDCIHFGIVKEIEETTIFRPMDWKIMDTKDAEEVTNNMLGFGMNQSQRIIIDYDKDHEHFVVRRYSMEYGESGDSP